jgi:uncharacterized protein YbjT (DUF2867 family)
MAETKTIAVIGATGAQGGGLVQAILADAAGTFAARAITRDPDSDKAQALAAAGAEVVAADSDDAASLERAFAGAHGAFCVTNFWEHHSPERELAQAANLARAAKAAGVAHVVWSTLEDTRAWVPLDDDRVPTLQGKYKVPHFDAKGEADPIFRDESAPTTFLRAAFYWDNFLSFGMGPRQAEDGTLTLGLPLGGAKLPGVAVKDIGRCAYGIFKGGPAMAGQYVGVAGDILTGPQMAAAFTRALGRTVTFSDIPFEVYRGLGFPGADDLANMFQVQALFEEAFCKNRDVVQSRALNPELSSFDAWLADNASRIPIG